MKKFLLAIVLILSILSSNNVALAVTDLPCNATSSFDQCLRLGASNGAKYGTQTNDTPCIGCVGETLTGQLLLASATSLTTATAKTITSVTLTPGDWFVWAQSDYILTAATATNFTTGLSTTTNTLGGQDTFKSIPLLTTLLSDTFSHGPSAARFTVATGATQVVYLIGKATFSAGTMTAYGTIWAQRAR